MSENPGVDATPVDAKPSSQGDGETKRKKGWRFLTADYGRHPRWLLAFVLLLACLGGLFTSSFSICSDQTVTKGADTTVTRTCNEPGVKDAGVVATALFIVLLLVPDMSEVGVFGVSLKRRLVAAEEKASESVAKAEKLENQIQTQSVRIDMLTQTVAAANAQAISNVFLTTSEELRQRDEELPEKAEAFKRGEISEPTSAADVLPTEAPDPALANSLIRNWEVLAASLRLGAFQRSYRRSDIPRLIVSADEADRFTNVFAEELDIVRAARNNVAHARPITNDDLQTAVDISDRLLQTLASLDKSVSP